MKKELQKTIVGGLDSILNPAPVAQAPKAEPIQEPEAKGERNKAVCYNLNPELIKTVKDIAYWDRKTANAVVTEALERYVTDWNKKNTKQ